MDENTTNDSITINKKMLRVLAPVLGVIGVLLSKGEVGPLILFLMGIAAGIFIDRYYKEGSE